MKKVGMLCHPFRVVGVQAEEAYTRKMVGMKQNYKERQRGRFRLPECEKYLARGHWLRTAKPRTLWRRELQNRKEKGKTGVTRPGLTGCHS